MPDLSLNSDEAEQCLQAFKQSCDLADKSKLISSEECTYWIFEQGYKAALQAQLNKPNQLSTHGPLDRVSDMLASGFALLEKAKCSPTKLASS